ncbi:hypothetical protein ACWDSD_18090 [Streptomyces spiralis]
MSTSSTATAPRHEVTVDAQTGKVTTMHAAQGHAGSRDTDDDRRHD